MISMFGPNASGKTTLIRALQVMKHLISNGAVLSGHTRLPYDPFSFVEPVGRPNTFDIVFTKNKKLYHYAFSFTGAKITHEKLTYSPNGRETLLFERHESRYQFTADKAFLEPLVSKNIPDKLFLVTAAQFNFQPAKEILDFFTNDLCFVYENSNFSLGFHENINSLMNETFLINSDYKRFVIAFLSAADLSIKDILIRKIAEPSATINNGIPTMIPAQYTLTFVHEIAGKEYRLPAELESQGTMTLFGLAVVFYKAFNANKVIVCDELDIAMHPSLLKMLVQSFASSSAPESQLIFTTHNTSIMCDELFRRDQIWFFDKNDDGETDLFSLADFKARPTDNYERDYLLGRYGAVPAVITFLKEDTPQ
jgi:AAA15 family ATPase/GTPase